jgi:hypothetical protein
MKICRLYADDFDWIRWRACSIFEDFSFQCRYSDIIQNRHIFKKYDVGYLKSEKLACRPKKDNMAVMFFKDGEFSWCHLTKKEFEEIFNDLQV